MWQQYISTVTLDETLAVLTEQGPAARLVAGATDLMLELERGLHPQVGTLVDITRIVGLDEIVLDEDGWLHLGPLVTHNHCVASKLLREYARPLVQAAWQVGSPQIRNRGTVVGNLVTASPANDTITPLIALGARLVLQSQRGKRLVSLAEFYTGVRRTILAPDEMVVDIQFRALRSNQQGAYVKYALRRAQAISLINLAVVITWEAKHIQQASITLGAVAPTIIHAPAAESYLVGRELDEITIQQAAQHTAAAARPIDDLRSSARYREQMVRVLAGRTLASLAHGGEPNTLPADPVLLWGGTSNRPSVLRESITHNHRQVIETHINGKPYILASGQHKSLLRLLREDAGLTGTKEGCAEGECGACTIFLDGTAVMSCLVPAPRAHGAEITTIEGLAQDNHLHPVQQSFIDFGAVQCGYCTPGFVMSAVKLLEEKSTPTQEQIRQAITGNLCRCTGYYKIVEAIDNASRR